MFYLPNKRPIDADGAIKAILGFDDGLYFLDKETGNVCCIEPDKKKETRELLAKVRNKTERYVEIPLIKSERFDDALIGFIDLVFVEDSILGSKLREIVIKGDEKKFFKEIESTKWIDAWDQWIQDEAYEVLEFWLESLDLGITEEWEGCDDCEICKATKNGVNDKDSLMVAFKKQNHKNEKLYEFKKEINKDRLEEGRKKVEKDMRDILKKYNITDITFEKIKELVFSDNGLGLVDASKKYNRMCIEYFEKAAPNASIDDFDGKK